MYMSHSVFFFNPVRIYKSSPQSVASLNFSGIVLRKINYLAFIQWICTVTQDMWDQFHFTKLLPIARPSEKTLCRFFNFLCMVCHCSGSLEPESSCHDRDWIMELPMEADILTFTGIFTPEDASVASCFPFDITISLSWFPLLGIPPLHSAIP